MNRNRALWLALALALSACGPAPEPAAEPAPEPSGGGEDEGGPETPSEQSEAAPDLDVLRALAAGDRDVVDAERGVAWARYFTDASGEDPAADDQGLVRSAERMCGEALDAALTRLARNLSMRFDDEAWSDQIACYGSVCRFPAMGEYDLDVRLWFVSEGGRLVLDSVVRIEGGPVTEEFVAAGEAWTAEHLEGLTPRECAPQ